MTLFKVCLVNCHSWTPGKFLMFKGIWKKENKENEMQLTTVWSHSKDSFLLVLLFVLAGDWDCHPLDPTVWHVSLFWPLNSHTPAGSSKVQKDKNSTSWTHAQLHIIKLSCLHLTIPLLTILTLFPVPAVSSYVAAIQGGRPPDRTHHIKQEVGHASWGGLTTGPKGEQ